MSKRITREKVEHLKSGLSALPEKLPDELSTKEAVEKMASEIRHAIDRGYSLEDIHGYLKGKGFDLKLTTLKTYYQQVSLKKRETPRKRIESVAEDKNANPSGARTGRSAKVKTIPQTAEKTTAPTGFVAPTEDY